MTNPARPVAPRTTEVAIAKVEAVLILAHNGIFGFLSFELELDEDDEEVEELDDEDVVLE